MFDEFLKEDKEEQKIVESTEDPAEILRQNGYKIKSINPTAFGLEIQLYKPVDDSVIDLLSNFKIKTKKNFIFIEN